MAGAATVGIGLTAVRRVQSQAPSLVMGSNSGVAQVVNSTANALWVSLQSQAVGTGGATGQVGGFTLFSDVTETPSSTGSATDFSTYTMPGNTMTANGQRLEISWCSDHAANTNSVTMQGTMFGQVIQGVASADSAGQACSRITAVRHNSSIIEIDGYTQGSGGFTQNRKHITGLDFTQSQVIKYGSSGASTGAGDTVGNYLSVTWFHQ